MSEREKQMLKTRFSGQKDGEHIQMLIRKHWIIDVKIGAAFMILGIFPLAIFLVAMVAFWPTQIEFYHLVILLSFLVYFMFAMLVTYIKWQNEELDVIIVTTERVIGHDQVDFFHKQISETDIGQIQDVKGVEKGFLSTIFRYGRLDIQTAADKIVFHIENVPYPYQLARQILDIRDKYLDRENLKQTYL